MHKTDLRMAIAALALGGCVTGGASKPRPRDIEVTEVNRGDVLRDDLQSLIGAARDSVFPALVNIQVVAVTYSGGVERKYSDFGSGTIFSKEGYVLTNQHVVTHGRRFLCTLSDRREIPAQLVGSDPLSDLAVLKLELSAEEKRNLPVARFGDSDSLQTGETVMAMGSPFALSRSVTLGIVSNPSRALTGGLSGEINEMQLEAGQTTGLFTRWIQHDALILPGNSGGPLVNLRGEVVGVNELGGNNVGFAIPAALAQTVAQELVEHGAVTRSSLGMTLRPLQRTGLTEGVLINSVDRDTAAERAGLKAGDVLLAIDGAPVNIKFAEEVPPFLLSIASRPPGTRLALRVRREGKTLELAATTEKMQRDRGAARLLRAWGFTVEEITPRRAVLLSLPNTDGALITGVKAGGPAALSEPALRSGDVIRAVDGAQVKSLAALLERYGAIDEQQKKAKEKDKKAPPKPILLEVSRHGEDQVTLIKPAASEEDQPPIEVAKGWLGATTQPVAPELAEKLGFTGLAGYRVARVYPGAAAEKAGVKVGDLIVAAGGEKFGAQSGGDANGLSRVVRRHYEGEAFPLTVRRAGAQEPLELSVTLERERLSADEAPRYRDAEFELAVREVTFFDRDEKSWGPQVHGVLVASIESAGWAGLAGVQPGDLIEQIGGHEVGDLASFKAALAAVSKARPARFVIIVLRGVRTHYEFVEPDWKPAARASSASDEDGGEE